MLAVSGPSGPGCQSFVPLHTGHYRRPPSAETLRRLVRHITAGGLSPGEKLPTENPDTSKALAVARRAQLREFSSPAGRDWPVTGDHARSGGSRSPGRQETGWEGHRGMARSNRRLLAPGDGVLRGRSGARPHPNRAMCGAMRNGCPNSPAVQNRRARKELPRDPP
jgi:hypothetical protein